MQDSLAIKTAAHSLCGLRPLEGRALAGFGRDGQLLSLIEMLARFPGKPLESAPRGAVVSYAQRFDPEKIKSRLQQIKEAWEIWPPDIEDGSPVKTRVEEYKKVLAKYKKVQNWTEDTFNGSKER